MSFGVFVRANLGPAVFAGVGAAVAVWGFTSDFMELWTAGMRPEHIQLTGFVLFAIGMVQIAYRQHLMIERRLGGIEVPAVAIGAPRAWISPTFPNPTTIEAEEAVDEPPPILEPPVKGKGSICR